MPYSKEIVTLIDSYIAADYVRAAFQSGKHYGLVEVSHQKTANGMVVAPIKGEERIVFDDRFNWQTYHRITGDKTYTKSENSTGRNESTLIERVPMCMVTFAKRSKLQLTSEALEQAMVKHLAYRLTPTELTLLNLKNCEVLPVSADFNQFNVFGQEYQNVETFLIENLIYFKINYIIESSFGKGCFNTTEIECG